MVKRAERGTRGRAVAEHLPEHSDPLAIEPGDDLVVAERETIWSGWLWCTAPNGKSGWVPSAYVDRQGDTAIALRAYDAVELAVTPGEELLVEDEESGWMWCSNAAGKRGWVPAQVIEADPGGEGQA